MKPKEGEREEQRNGKSLAVGKANMKGAERKKNSRERQRERERESRAPEKEQGSPG